MNFTNPVRQTFIRPPGSQAIIGSFRVTQDFGPTSLAAEPAVSWLGGEGIAAGTYPHFHKGIDIADRQCGADVIAAGPGTVLLAGKDTDGAIRVVIDHGTGYRSRYWHLRDETVTVGEVVAAGHLIGHVGSTGNSTGCHLHFAIYRNGTPVDPWRRLKQNDRRHP